MAKLTPKPATPSTPSPSFRITSAAGRLTRAIRFSMHQASRHSGSSSQWDVELKTRRLAVEILPLGHGGLDDFSKQHFRIILQSGGTFPGGGSGLNATCLLEEGVLF
ncbi:hypothetical protein AVEN_229808-1 [Araneus ventricosus]|uniref:Uncharacterized protein n=1 Tax=Araneus ventricosus TaxID=182803 RepID=A0A4Y2U082_ARAVE|nr:hypothetical protein AVEN_229808-1 [Araneus ventricosus]